MSHTALDRTTDRGEGRLYFERWQGAALSLGEAISDHAFTNVEGRALNAAYQRVKEARAELVATGAIRKRSGGHAGRTAVYEIVLAPAYPPK